MKLYPNRLQQTTVLIISILSLAGLLLSGCSRRDPEAEKQQARTQVFAKLRSCVPVQKPEEKSPEEKAVTAGQTDKLRIAIAGVTLNPDETAVRIVAYALDEDIDFDLPVYWMSRGRWLINEQGRAYLLDERCREYKLKDRRSSTPDHPIPLNGRIRLNKGQVFEATLSFPRFDQSQIGVLVYGERTFPFWLPNQANAR
jgi:hypothetical protein